MSFFFLDHPSSLAASYFSRDLKQILKGVLLIV